MYCKELIRSEKSLESVVQGLLFFLTSVRCWSWECSDDDWRQYIFNSQNKQCILNGHHNTDPSHVQMGRTQWRRGWSWSWTTIAPSRPTYVIAYYTYNNLKTYKLKITANGRYKMALRPHKSAAPIRTHEDKTPIEADHATQNHGIQSPERLICAEKLSIFISAIFVKEKLRQIWKVTAHHYTNTTYNYRKGIYLIREQ